MYVRIGILDFEVGECVLKSLTRTSKYTPLLDRFLITERHNYEGEFIPPQTITTQSGAFDWLRIKMKFVELSLSNLTLDVGFGLIDDDGQQTTNFVGPNGNWQGAKSGEARVVAPISYGFKDQAEGLSGRTFRFSIEQDLIPPNAAFIFSFSETISWRGDTGPRFVGVELDTGEADIQQVNQKTLQYITQSGNAAGIGVYPQFPDKRYPLPNAAPPIADEQEPVRRGSRSFLYPIRWRYVMMSTIDQFGKFGG